jgi:hypothetical protein
MFAASYLYISFVYVEWGTALDTGRVVHMTTNHVKAATAVALTKHYTDLRTLFMVSESK